MDLDSLTAESDRELVRQLLAMPRGERLAAAAGDAHFHRRTLARRLTIEAARALSDPAGDGREAAELAAVIAGALPGDPDGEAHRTAAWAFWLLGKTMLRSRRWRQAEDAFRAISTFIPGGAASEAEALAWLGFAQLYEDLGRGNEAAAMFLRAAFLYSSLGAETAEAACQAQLGLLLVRGGDLEGARRPLRAALNLFAEGLAPSLAARLRLALAGIETVRGPGAAAAREFGKARALYDLAPSPAEETERCWREARIVAAAGKSEQAERLFERVRQELLVRGSLTEAAQCSREQLLIQVESRRFDAAHRIAGELALAFGAAGEPWARELAELARVAGAEPAELYRASYRLKVRLDRQEAAQGDRPALLVPSRVLADRLFFGCGEIEDRKP